MKKLLLTAFALTAAVSVFAQGTVTFNNRNSLVTTHIYGPDAANPTLSLVGYGSNDTPTGATPFQADGMALIGASGIPGQYGASTTLAQLLDFNGTTANASALTPDGVTTTFRTGAVAGNLVSITTDTLGNLNGNGTTPATIEVVAWDDSSGLYANWTAAYTAWQAGTIAAGESGLIPLPATGGGTTLTPVLAVESFNLYYIPEPSTFALAGLGLATLLALRRRNS